MDIHQSIFYNQKFLIGQHETEVGVRLQPKILIGPNALGLAGGTECIDTPQPGCAMPYLATALDSDAHIVDRRWRLVRERDCRLRGQVDLVPLTADDAASLCQKTGFDCANLVRVLTLDEASTGLYMAYGLQTSPEVVQRT